MSMGPSESCVILVEEPGQSKKLDKEFAVDVFEEVQAEFRDETKIINEMAEPSGMPMFIKYLVMGAFVSLVIFLPALILRSRFGGTNIEGFFTGGIQNPQFQVGYTWSVIATAMSVACFLFLSALSFICAALGWISKMKGSFILGSIGHQLMVFIIRMRIGLALIITTPVVFGFSEGLGAKPYGFYRVYACSVIFATLMMLKGLGLSLVGDHFKNLFKGQKNKENLLALSSLGKLWAHYLPDFEVSKKKNSSPRHLDRHITDEQAAALGARLYDAISREHRVSEITATHFEPILDQTKSAQFLDYLDSDHNGDLIRDDFALGVKRIYNEWINTRHSEVEMDTIVGKLDELVTTVCVLLTISMAFGLFGLSITQQILLQANLLVVFKFFFEDVFTRMFRSLIFIFCQHPYDVGDVIFMRNKIVRVKHIGLWTTTFENADRSLLYMSNTSLASARICSFTRSPPQALELTLAVKNDISRKQLASMERKINDFIRESPRDFLLDVCYVKNITLVNQDAMTFQLQYTQRTCFVNRTVKNKRHNMFTRRLYEILKEESIGWAPQSLDLPRVGLTPH